MKFEGKNLDAYDELIVSMEANARKLNLLIGVCDDSHYRNEIIEQYESEVEEGIYCYQITLQPERPSIRFLLEDLIEKNPQIKEQDRVVVTVLGADKLRFLALEEERRSQVEEFAGYMQWTREGLRRFPFSIVIWVTTNVETVLKQKAKDFWSWRKGVFRFETKPKEFIRKADLEPIREYFGLNFQAESTTLIPIDDIEALVKKIEATDPEDGRLISLYNSLGNAYIKRYETGESRNYQQEAKKSLDCFEKILLFLDQDSLDAAHALNQLGWIHNSLGNYAEAEDLFQHSLFIREKQLGENHIDVSLSLNNLAELYRTQEKYQQAEPLYRRSLAISEKQLGKADLSVAFSLSNLALLYDSQKKYEEAESLYHRALSIFEMQLDSDHPFVAQSLNNFAVFYYNQGKYQDAEPLYVRALFIRNKQLGKDHPRVANSLLGLGALYYSQNKYLEAEQLIVYALEIFQQSLGMKHPDTQNTKEWLDLIQQAILDE